MRGSADRRAGRLRPVALEGTKFLAVGLVALVIDVGVFNSLRFAGGAGPLFDWPVAAKVVSSILATAAAWWLNRRWTFRHRRRESAHREVILFFIVAVTSLLISAGCLAISHHVLGFRSALADNISANVVGLALATAYRFWAYRTFVFNEVSNSVQVTGMGFLGAEGPNHSGVAGSEYPARQVGASKT